MIVEEDDGTRQGLQPQTKRWYQIRFHSRIGAPGNSSGNRQHPCMVGAAALPCPLTTSTTLPLLLHLPPCSPCTLMSRPKLFAKKIKHFSPDGREREEKKSAIFSLP